MTFSGAFVLGAFLLLALMDQATDWVDVIPGLVALLSTATIAVFIGVSQALHIKRHETRKLLLVVLVIASALRVVAVLTSPMLEVDFYRYLWDGKVLASGVSPYAYSPAQITNADNSFDDNEYQKTVALAQASESNLAILNGVHFPQYTTIYPPVSQCVFAATVACLPQQASVWSHVTILKTVLVLFDVMTMLLLWRLMVRRGIHVAWMISYAWNPLVIKEVANSAHLDSIAVFFVICAIYFSCRWYHDAHHRPFDRRLLLCGASLALGFGAKIFPIILAPLFFVHLAKKRVTAGATFVLAFAIPAACISLIFSKDLEHREKVQQEYASQSGDQQSSEGLSSFLTTWRMNDVVFSGIYLNLLPDADTQPRWYVLTNSERRERICGWISEQAVGSEDPAFFLARLVTIAAFALFYLWILFAAYRKSILDVSRYSWVLIVFLFLQPTVNPWYWLWIAPLASLSKDKGSILVSGLLLLYYLRFWFTQQTLAIQFAGREYLGADIFDDFIAWFEFTAIVCIFIISKLFPAARCSSS